MFAYCCNDVILASDYNGKMMVGANPAEPYGGGDGYACAVAMVGSNNNNIGSNSNIPPSPPSGNAKQAAEVLSNPEYYRLDDEAKHDISNALNAASFLSSIEGIAKCIISGGKGLGRALFGLFSSLWSLSSAKD